AGERGDFVPLHERAHAAGERLYRLVFARQHGGKIETHTVDFDAMLRGILFRKNEMITRGEEGFARDAANVEAGAAELAVLLDDGGFESKLRGANRSDVAARAGADDDDVELIHEMGS